MQSNHSLVNRCTRVIEFGAMHMRVMSGRPPEAVLAEVEGADGS